MSWRVVSVASMSKVRGTMTLMFPLLYRPLCFEENRVQVLIIEDPKALRSFMKELTAQADGQNGEIVLAVDYTPRALSDFAALMTDPFRIETGSKKLSAKMQEAAVRAAEEHEQRLQAVLTEINTLAAEISLSLDFSAAFNLIEGPDELIKLMKFRLDAESLSFPELVLEWMKIQREFLNKRLFIFYGLKWCLDRDELSDFYRSVFYEKLDVLLIEPVQRGPARKEECVTIIDEDLCIIR